MFNWSTVLITKNSFLGRLGLSLWVMVCTLDWDKMLTGSLESDGGIDAQQLKRKSKLFVIIKLFGSKTIKAASSLYIVA